MTTRATSSASVAISLPSADPHSLAARFLRPFGNHAGVELLLSLGVLWVLLALYSFADQPVELLGHPIVQSEIVALLRPSPQPPVVSDWYRPSPAGARQLPVSDGETLVHTDARSVDTAPQRILILGDSMIEGLLPRLADYASENHHAVDAVIWYGSRTIDWARGTRLADAIAAHRPTFVIVVVGSSELHVLHPEKRAAAIQQMLHTIGDRQLIWVGPPNWTKDTGINDVIEQRVGRSRYFRSYALSFERKRDGIHPTLASSRIWMDRVVDFITNESASPIKLDPPTKTGAPRPNVRVFPPPTA